VNNGLLVLKKDGPINTPWVLANPGIIPDLNVEGYVNQLLQSKRKQNHLHGTKFNRDFVRWVGGKWLTDKGLVKIDTGRRALSVGLRVYKGDTYAPDGRYKVNENNNVDYFEISNGTITLIKKRVDLAPVFFLIVLAIGLVWRISFLVSI
jgi:hypothetical protein